METEFKSKAQVLDRKMVEVVAPDGEIFQIYSQIGIYDSEETQHYYLHLVEAIFDKHFSEDKEVMSNRIWREMMLNGVPFIGMSSGNRQENVLELVGAYANYERRKIWKLEILHF